MCSTKRSAFCHPLCMKTTIFPSRNSMNRSPVQLSFFHIPLLVAFACFALFPEVQAVCQQGCGVGNANTFLGENVLNANTTGIGNVGVGYHALLSNTTGFGNTATGTDALGRNTTGN